MLKTPLCQQLGLDYPLFAVLYAGESCGLVHDIKPAAQIVRDVVREAAEAIEELKRL